MTSASVMNTLQVMTSTLVTVAVFSGFAQSIGVLMASAELGVAPLGQLPTEKGITDLKSIYGSSVVNQAIGMVGKDADIITLAFAVEGAAIQNLRNKYGDDATNKAIESCGITEYACVELTARSLSGLKKTGTETPAKVEEAIKTGKRKGRQVAQPVKDTHTGITYSSKAKAGMAVAAEYGLDSKNHFIWYEVIKKDSKRFVRA